MFLPVERSITVSAPHFVAQRIFSTSSSIDEATALLPMLALILTRKLRPMIIGSLSGWLTLEGMIARPRATSSRTNSGVMTAGMAAPNDWPGCWAIPPPQARPPAASRANSRSWFSRTAMNSISGVTIPGRDGRVGGRLDHRGLLLREGRARERPHPLKGAAALSGSRHRFPTLALPRSGDEGRPTRDSQPRRPP